MSDFFSKVFKFDYLGQLMKDKRMCFFCIPCFFPHDAAASDDDQSEHDHSALADYFKAISTFFCNPFFGPSPSPSPSPARIESCQKVFDDKSGLISVLNLSRNAIKKSKNVVFGLHMSGGNTAKNDTFSSCSGTPTLDLGGGAAAAAGSSEHDSKNNNDDTGRVVFEIGEAVPLDAELPIPYLFYDVDANGLNPSTTQCPVVTGYPSDEFLSFCHLCKEKLDMGREIYMYRGNRAFCSMECRYKEILDDELWGMKAAY